MVKTLPASAGGAKDAGSVPGLGRYPGMGNGNPLQYSCLENSMDRGAWWALVLKGHKESDMTGRLITLKKLYSVCWILIDFTSR